MNIKVKIPEIRPTAVSNKMVIIKVMNITIKSNGDEKKVSLNSNRFIRFIIADTTTAAVAGIGIQ